MPKFSLPVDVDFGPVIIARAGLAVDEAVKLQQEGHVVPPPVHVRALLNPGVAHSTVNVITLNEIRGTTPSVEPTASDGSSEIENSHARLCIVFPGEQQSYAIIRSVTVLIAQQSEAAPLTIGRDILDSCDFAYHGPEQKYTLDIPTDLTFP